MSDGLEPTANGKRIGTFDAYSPHQAARWTRTSLMMLTTELDEPTAKPSTGPPTAKPKPYATYAPATPRPSPSPTKQQP
ncbi:hypothetical protein [Streptomyces armeniacus]|uniref:hypothetical protein n=1 Tax=Streptomyces armeniacus TaxID=83291 RepID=UPI001AD823DB|nr:hypothetical protein [Streptomyces armeniacus]